MDTESTRNVAGGRDNAPPARVADDERHIAQARIITLLNGRIERVAIDMGDAEQLKFRVPDDACALANRAGSSVG